MNKIHFSEMLDYCSTQELMHIGVNHIESKSGPGSGRYRYGSGDSPFQHEGDFLTRVDRLKAQGITKKSDLAKAMGMKGREFNAAWSNANNERILIRNEKIRNLSGKGLGATAIAKKMDMNEGTVRAVLKSSDAPRKEAKIAAEEIKKAVDSKKLVDIGPGVNLELGISETRMDSAVEMLRSEGYHKITSIKIPQEDESRKTTLTVLTKPEVTYQEAWDMVKNGELGTLNEYKPVLSENAPTSFQYPASINSSRVKIRYGDEGGNDMDGVIQLRRNVDDLSLGSKAYAQVRIEVDGTHYLKGMAIYGQDKDFPKGVDVVFNTNKPSGTPKLDVLKKNKTDDPNNPFGAAIKDGGQSYYIGKDGKKHLSAINRLKEEGEYLDQRSSLSSQFLVKQNMPLIQNQLNIAYKNKLQEFDEIKAINNPTVRAHYLEKFSEDCDKAAWELHGAALPKQTWNVILPVRGMKDTEVYAPNYNNGEKLALVRYPHGGIFEIPVLTVNNNHKEARDTLGRVTDAIGINKKTADQLSGADFDGDTVIAIPLGKKYRIDTAKPLQGLVGYDPKLEYATKEVPTGKVDKNGNPKYAYYNKYGDKVPIMSEGAKGRQMGMASNLITDMTLKGAPMDELVKAVKHSQTVIDAPKHKLDYKRSEIENDIPALRKKWLGHLDDDGNPTTGASTLISRRKQEIDVPERKWSRINKETGEKEHVESGREYPYYDKKTKLNDPSRMIRATQKEKLILETPDVRTLSSGTAKEEAYAMYSNAMKALANDARRELVNTPPLTYNRTSAKTYAPEVKTLTAKLKTAEMNAPRERKALALAYSQYHAKKLANPNMSDKDYRKIKHQDIARARAKVGASSKARRIKITDREWDAIQSGAVSNNFLKRILRYSDTDALRQRATPKIRTEISSSRAAQIKAMSNTYTQAQIAEYFGLSPSTVSRIINS